AYNSADTSMMKKLLFFVLYSYNPTAYYKALLEADAEAADKRIKKIKKVQKKLQSELQFVQKRMIQYANSKRIEEPILQKRDKVYLL
ncbi:hypothetical protein M406DRAFT_224997, partial [Cryphonectria parasitica EP155]